MAVVSAVFSPDVRTFVALLAKNVTSPIVTTEKSALLVVLPYLNHPVFVVSCHIVAHFFSTVSYIAGSYLVYDTLPS